MCAKACATAAVQHACVCVCHLRQLLATRLVTQRVQLLVKQPARIYWLAFIQVAYSTRLVRRNYARGLSVGIPINSRPKILPIRNFSYATATRLTRSRNNLGLRPSIHFKAFRPWNRKIKSSPTTRHKIRVVAMIPPPCRRNRFNYRTKFYLRSFVPTPIPRVTNELAR